MRASNQTNTKTIAFHNKLYNMCDNNENDWYFGAITRSEAENILINNGLSDGLYLVRESVSSPGDYVLSCVQRGSVVHYQIQKIGAGPSFLVNDRVIYGLDLLLKYLKELKATNSSVITLTDHCRNVCPPPDTQMQGKATLLHRANREHRLVTELLTSIVQPNLEVKDGRGRTALHLAIHLDETIDSQIVKQLISAGADVNCKDFESITPLELCAKLNKPLFAKLLLMDGKATTYDRSVGHQQWVALHFGAYFGSEAVMRALLSYGAAPQPRDSSDQRPTDIALKMNHLECKKLCDFYSDRPLNHSLYRNQWLLEHIRSRYAANKLFRSSGMRDGSYFVRISHSNPDHYILSMAYNQRVYNFQIQFKNNCYFIDSGPYWPTLEHLISYHMVNSDGLPSRLIAPISSFIDTSINEKLIQSNVNKSKHSESLNENVCNENKDLKSILFIDESRVSAGCLIGTGEYGDVFRGFWKRDNNKRVLVAIKIVRRQGLHMSRKTDSFVKEVEVMASLKHPNIIRLLGVCVGPTLMMIQELAPMGSVLDFLMDKSNDVHISHAIKLWSIQMAIGMRYLERRHFVHRDLAARNVLIESLKQIKISDFGLSRALGRDESTYKASNWDRWPLKWYAPESLKYGTFTHATDVWSYGVVLWEMYSSGAQPYPDIESSLIIRFLESGKRLSQPEMCADIVFALMSLCWSLEPKNRPTFSEIVKLMLTNDSEYESMENELKLND